MAATDAKPFPIKNTAYRVYFPIFDADGDLVTGAAGLDSERSLDGATFADCTNEAIEVATASGIYYLELTAAEMNTDCTVVIVKTSTSGAKTTPIILYPVETGDIDVDVTAWLGTAAATPTVAGVPEVDVTHWLGTAAATPSVAGVPEVDLTHVAGSTTGVSTFPATITTINADTDNIQTRLPTSLVSGRMDSSVGAMAADVITAAATATDFSTEVNSGRATSAAQTTLQADIDDIQARLPAALVSGRIDASVGAMATDVITSTALATSAVTEITTGVLTTQMTESYAADGVAPTAAQALFAMQQALFDHAISGTSWTVKKIDGTTTALTLTLNDATTPTAVARTA